MSQNKPHGNPCVVISILFSITLLTWFILRLSGFGIWKRSKNSMFNTTETFLKTNNGNILLLKAISRLLVCQHRSSGDNCTQSPVQG